MRVFNVCCLTIHLGRTTLPVKNSRSWVFSVIMRMTFVILIGYVSDRIIVQVTISENTSSNDVILGNV